MLLLLFTTFAVFTAGQADSKDALKARELVTKAELSVNNFAVDTSMSYLRDNLGEAEGLLIIPALIKGAFIIGGSGGSGVLLARGEDNQWSNPAFYTMGTGSIGFQWGGEVSEIILMIMTRNGMDKLLSSSFKLGTDASVAAGPVGVGAKAQLADVLAFSRTKGAFAGMSVEGAVIKTRSKYNAAYYGQAEVRPVDILISRTVNNPHADGLRSSVVSLVSKGTNTE